jgi:hypothetical protein
MFKKILVLLVTSYGLLVTNSNAQETLTITTYYPSPYGSYNELRTYSNTYLATDSGNVGIGTTGPGEKLTISAPGSGYGGVLVTGGASGGIGYSVDSGANDQQLQLRMRRSGSANDVDWYLYSPAGSTDLRLYSGGDRVTFKAGGNVGIGTVSPTERLHIQGRIRIVDGSQAAGRVLTSDANGVGTWTTAAGWQNCQMCYQKWADGDWGQCGPPYTAVPTCAVINTWTNAHRDDTDNRGGGCYQRWMILCP